MRGTARGRPGGRRFDRQSEGGFTLVENLAAIFILTGGLIAVAQLLAVSLEMYQLGRTSAAATRLAQAKVEELMKLDLSTAAAVQISPARPDPLTRNVPAYFDLPVPADVAAEGLYTRRWRVDEGPTASTRRLSVRVVPASPSRLSHKPVELTTILRQW